MSSILSGTAKAARSSTVLDLTEPMASSASRSAAPAVNSSPAPVPTAPPDHAVGNEAVTQSVGVLNDKRGGLMSSATSAAVDSAFNALAQTVLVHNVRTLEDLVREMLRPMLKVWLDDNLPGIVERLVRAEIERVSRGRGG
jgi:cell pole-organizing protein PopZ